MNTLELHFTVFSKNRNKPSGIDCLRMNHIRRNHAIFGSVMLFIISSVPSSGVIPSEWQLFILKPHYLGGERNSLSSYGFISAPSCPFSILQTCILTTMTAFLDKFNVVSDKQHSFVAKRGKKHFSNPFLISSFWRVRITRSLMAFSFDVSKAFNTVNPSILLNQLYSMGFRGLFLNMYYKFLSYRRQLVSIDNVLSTIVPLLACVAHGSILSPLLFNPYVNDI